MRISVLAAALILAAVGTYFVYTAPRAEALTYPKLDGLLWVPPVHRTYWSDANSYCDASTIGGRVGWRLPSAAELMRLYTEHARALPSDWPSDFAWTSTKADDERGDSRHVAVGRLPHVEGGPTVDSRYRGWVACVYETKN